MAYTDHQLIERNGCYTLQKYAAVKANHIILLPKRTIK
jgi:hypothetical protein